MAMQKQPQRKDYLFPNEISHKRSFKDDYEITDNLGSGAFGVVRKARSKQDPQLYVAIKTINKADCKPEELFAEVKLLRLLAGSKGILRFAMCIRHRIILNYEIFFAFSFLLSFLLNKRTLIRKTHISDYL